MHTLDAAIVVAQQFVVAFAVLLAVGRVRRFVHPCVLLAHFALYYCAAGCLVALIRR
jgi:hypothetical protein